MNDSAIRALWLAISLLTAALIGTAAGIISWIKSGDAADSLFFGCTAFGVSLTLILGVIRFARGDRD